MMAAPRTNPPRWCGGFWHLLQISVGLAWAFAASANASTNAGDCVKTVRWYDDAPYSFKGADGKPQGLDVELIAAVLAKMNCRAKYIEMPWARALVELESGRLDVLSGALQSPARQRFAYFSKPVGSSPNILFVSPEALKTYRLVRLTDILGTPFKLGAQIGVNYGPEYDALITQPAFAAHVTQFTARRGAWKMLAQGHIDGIIADEVTALVELQQLGLTAAAVRTTVTVSTAPARVAFSKVSVPPEFVAEFNKALDATVAKGTYREIWERYVPCPVSIEKMGCK